MMVQSNMRCSAMYSLETVSSKVAVLQNGLGARTGTLAEQNAQNAAQNARSARRKPKPIDSCTRATP